MAAVIAAAGAEAPALLAVLAHPDDETFRCGGTLALLARRGVRVHVLTATRGQAGSCGSPPICTPAELPRVRAAELRCACRALRVEEPILLDHADGALAEVAGEVAVAEVLAVVRRVRPQVLLTWPPHGLSGHPDHSAVSRWATDAYARALQEGLAVTALYYIVVPAAVAAGAGIAGLHALPDAEVDITVDVSAVWEAKMAALRCHYTQSSGATILQAPLERQRLFLGTEHFQRAAVRSWPDLLTELLTR